GYRNDPCRLYNRAFHDRCCFTGNGWTTTIYVLDDVIINALVLRDSVNHLKDFQIGFPVGIAGKYTRWDDTNHFVGRRDERHYLAAVTLIQAIRLMIIVIMIPILVFLPFFAQ